MKVTSENFEELLIKSAEEALEHAKTKLLRYCHKCKKGTETLKEDCVECGLSKPHNHPSQCVTVYEED